MITKARIKFIITLIFIFTFIYLTASMLRGSIVYQISVFSLFLIYYITQNREQLYLFLNFTKFLFIVIVLLHTIFYLYKGLSNSWNFANQFYQQRWESILLRVFIIPNIFAFVNIMLSKINLIDLILVCKNNRQSKILYILMISGIEVMERLRIYYEFHPDNLTNKGLGKILHYLAVPLSLFFGIYRNFDNKYELLIDRENKIKGSF